MRKAAARLSADSPKRNAMRRSASFEFLPVRCCGSLGFIALTPRERQSALIDDSALLTGCGCDRFDRILERCGRKRAFEHAVEVRCLAMFAFGGRPDNDDELAARLGGVAIGERECGEFVTSNFLVQLGQFPAHSR